MSEVKFVLRDATRDISGTWHGSCANRAVAALSADPVTIEELEVALERFMKPDQSGVFHFFSRGVDDEPWDAGLVVIDLAARMVVVESTYFSPSQYGSLQYHNGRHGTDIEVRYELADEWMLSDDAENWMTVARERRQGRAGQAPLDVRAVLYGRPLIEFLATECFTVFPQRERIAQAVRVKWAEQERERGMTRVGESSAIPGLAVSGSATDQAGDDLSEADLAPRTRSGHERYASPFYDTLKEIHVRWLMTPREDLLGESPREVMLAEHERLMSDMEHRCDQWSQMQECPRGLDPTSYAFRFGGFGTHEIVKYYDLVREVLWSCWEQLLELAQSPHPLRRPVSLAQSDFLAAELPRLEQFRDRWLDTPDEGCEFQTPKSIIDRERARIPEAVSGHDAMIDPDCPCCQMLAELPGPAFWHLDGSGMDDDFAFDIYHRTREEWDVEQETNRAFDREFAVQPANGKASASEPIAEMRISDSIWSRSFSIADASAPVSIRLFGLAGHLGELTIDLRAFSNARQLIDQLNRDFGNLRDVLYRADVGSESTLVGPTISRFTETLDDVAAACPDLEPKCSDLICKLQGFLER